jgi:hypothetical protein
MSTKKFKLTDADLNDSEDEFLPDFAGGPNNNTNNNDTVTTVEEVDNAQKEGEIDAKEQEVNAQQQEIDAKEQEIDAKEQEVNAQQQEIDAQKEEIDAQQQVVNTQQQIKNYINDNTYINTHMPGVLDGDNDALYITLTSPDNNTTFYDERHDPTNETQKKLIPYIFLFAKTYRKIMNDFEHINLLISNNTDQEAAAKDIREKLDTLQGQLEVFYELPLQYGGASSLSSNLNDYFANKPTVLIVEDKIEIFFQLDDGQKTWADFTKEHIEDKVSYSYNKGDIQFDTKQNAQARLKTFENERLTNTGKKSMMSSMGSFFRGKKGGNKKQTRRPAIHKKRNTRRK